MAGTSWDGSAPSTMVGHTEGAAQNKRCDRRLRSGCEDGFPLETPNLLKKIIDYLTASAHGGPPL